MEGDEVIKNINGDKELLSEVSSFLTKVSEFYQNNQSMIDDELQYKEEFQYNQEILRLIDKIIDTIHEKNYVLMKDISNLNALVGKIRDTAKQQLEKILQCESVFQAHKHLKQSLRNTLNGQRVSEAFNTFEQIKMGQKSSPRKMQEISKQELLLQ